MPTAGEKICCGKWGKDTGGVMKSFPDGKAEKSAMLRGRV